MDFKAIAAIFWGFLLAAATVCGDEQRTRIEIRIIKKEVDVTN